MTAATYGAHRGPGGVEVSCFEVGVIRWVGDGGDGNEIIIKSQRNLRLK